MEKSNLALSPMDDGTTEGHASPEHPINIMLVDEDQRCLSSNHFLLSFFNFHVEAFTSPSCALEVLKRHAGDVAFVLVEVDMQEMHGFEFLRRANEAHGIPVIMMASDTRLDLMMRCVELGARFLAKKPLDEHTVANLWQHLGPRAQKTEKIKALFTAAAGEKGQGAADDSSAGEASKKRPRKEDDANDDGDGSTHQKKKYLIWSPFLQHKFLHALRILGGDGSPKKIEMLMNIEGITRKQISAHLQKHRLRKDKELFNSVVDKIYSGLRFELARMHQASLNDTMSHFHAHQGFPLSSNQGNTYPFALSNNQENTSPFALGSNQGKPYPMGQMPLMMQGASDFGTDQPPQIVPLYEGPSVNLMQNSPVQCSGSNIYEEIRKALQLGTAYDDSSSGSSPCNNGANETAGNVMERANAMMDYGIGQGNGTSFSAQNAETYMADQAAPKEVVNPTSSLRGQLSSADELDTMAMGTPSGLFEGAIDQEFAYEGDLSQLPYLQGIEEADLDFDLF